MESITNREGLQVPLYIFKRDNKTLYEYSSQQDRYIAIYKAAKYISVEKVVIEYKRYKGIK